MAFTPDGRCLAVAMPAQPEMTRLADGSYRTFRPIVEGIDLVDLTTATRGDGYGPGAIRSRRCLFGGRKDDGRGRRLGEADDPAVREPTTEANWANFTVRPGSVVRGALAFSPDGRGLAAGLDDTTVIIWDVADVREGVK